MSTVDRTVHAFNANVEIVRYDRAGAWYREIQGLPRVHLTVGEAARQAALPGFTWREGLPGGKRFDKIVRGLLSREP